MEHRNSFMDTLFDLVEFTGSSFKCVGDMEVLQIQGSLFAQLIGSIRK